MVHNLGPKWFKWSLLEGLRVVVFLYMIYDVLIDTSEQLMSQRHRIVPPAIRYKRLCEPKAFLILFFYKKNGSLFEGPVETSKR